jgi:hypothetical protein
MLLWAVVVLRQRFTENTCFSALDAVLFTACTGYTNFDNRDLALSYTTLLIFLILDFLFKNPPALLLFLMVMVVVVVVLRYVDSFVQVFISNPCPHRCIYLSLFVECMHTKGLNVKYFLFKYSLSPNMIK